MTAFVVIAAMLVAGALLFVLPPLLARRQPVGSGIELPQANAQVLREQIVEIDQQLANGKLGPGEHADVSAEIRRRVLEGAASTAPAVPREGRAWPTALLIGVLVPALVIGLYLALGSPAALDPAAVAAPAKSNHALSREQIAGMVARLAARLQSQPDDFDGWVMLARSRSAMAEYAGSADAWGRASALRPADAQLLAEQADMLAMARGRRLTGDPEALVQRALIVDGRNSKALALAGSAAFERGEYRQAIAHWRKLAEVAPEGSEFTRSVQASIADAQQRLDTAGGGGTAAGRAAALASNAAPVSITAPALNTAQAGAPASASASASAPASASGAALEGQVSLAAELSGPLQPTDTLFVIARPADGGRVPVAVFKRPLGTPPVAFRLDDSHSMNPAQPLSRAGRVLLVARVSRSGAPAPAAGDLEGTLGPVSVGTSALQLRIDRRLP